MHITHIICLYVYHRSKVPDIFFNDVMSIRIIPASMLQLYNFYSFYIVSDRIRAYSG